MSFRVEKDIMVPMPDGVRLATDAWIPGGGGPSPALLVRLPYGKDMNGLYAPSAPPTWASCSGRARWPPIASRRSRPRSPRRTTTRRQRLIVGPWDHLNSTGVYPDRRFGLMADALYNDLTGAHQRFFDRWLRGREGAMAGDAPVRIFVMGIDQWRDEQDWPLPGTRYVDYYLDSSGRANTADGDGRLRPDAPGDEHADVFPDGRAIFLTDGILRARYRNSLAEPELLTPGRVYEVTVDLSVTSNVFLPGHRIRLEVSSSNFPRFDRNTNTGGSVTEDGDEDARVAVNRVSHGPGHPSRLVLPVIAR
jgi:predicted acyl esterase